MHPQLTPHDIARFWSYVHKTETCWLWNNKPARYGVFHVYADKHYQLGAHRVSYELACGPIPPRLFVCHHCDVPGCVRPDHLFVGTTRLNMLDCSAKGRIAVGERNGQRVHPERVARGERNGNARLTWDDVRAIRASYVFESWREDQATAGVPAGSGPSAPSPPTVVAVLSDGAQLTARQLARFWSHVDKSDGCWLWNGNPGRYGAFSLSGERRRTLRAHRLSYEVAYGAVPPGLLVCHRCDVRGCVRPDHLFVANNRDNMRDCAAKGRLATGARSGARLHPQTRARGERNGGAKLSWTAVQAIRGAYAPDPTRPPAGRRGAGTISALAQRFGVSRRAIVRILSGETWRAD